MRYSLLVFILLFFTQIIVAQSVVRDNQEKYAIKIKRATTPIQLDGKLEEADWAAADVGKDFWQKSPRDDIKAITRTEFRLTYDDDFLYVGATCYDSLSHIVSTLKRDIGFWDGDNIGIVLDPLNETTSGLSLIHI